MSTVGTFAKRALRDALRRGGAAAELGRLSDQEIDEAVSTAPFLQDAIRKKLGAKQEARAAAFKRRAALLASAASEIPPLVKRSEETQAAADQARTTLLEKRKEADAAATAVMTAEYRWRSGVAAIDGELEASADPAIEQALERLQREYESLRCAVEIHIDLRGPNTPFRRNGATSSSEPSHYERRNSELRRLALASHTIQAMTYTLLEGAALVAAIERVDAAAHLGETQVDDTKVEADKHSDALERIRPATHPADRQLEAEVRVVAKLLPDDRAELLLGELTVRERPAGPIGG